MRTKVLKFHAVIFGSFFFPATPEIIMKIVQSFAPVGFMPAIINTVDPVSGLATSTISLISGTNEQIVFANDRIDISKAFPDSDDAVAFIQTAVDYLRRIDGGTIRGNRLGFIKDLALEDLSAEQENQVRHQILPQSNPDSLDWSARWSSHLSQGNEAYNVFIETLRLQNLSLYIGNQVFQILVPKLSLDISTAPMNAEVRFDVSNMVAALTAMNQIAQENIPHFQISE